MGLRKVVNVLYGCWCELIWVKVRLVRVGDGDRMGW